MWKWLALFALPGVGPALVGYKIWDEIRSTISEDPEVWERAIRAFERQDRKQAPAKGGVVFAGSSTIRFWRGLSEDMAPLPVIQRGFGGAKVRDVFHYLDRLITIHEPAMIVLYIGSNDLLDFGGNRPKTLAEMSSLYDTLIDALHARLPHASVVILATFPSPLNAKRSALINSVNAMLREAARDRPWLSVLDGNAALQEPGGEPKRALFLFDRTHLNKDGYAAWTQILRPQLLALWDPRLH